MSPTAFKQHVTQLLSDLQRCAELCTIILQNRRVGNKHDSLDRLQAGITATSKTITVEFNSLREVFGSRFDTGDDFSKHALKGAIRSVELDVRGKLEDIASRRNEGLPGFRDMLRKIQMMEQTVSDSFESFAQRLERPAPQPIPKPTANAPEPKPKPKQPEPKKPKSNEIVMQLKEFEKYIDHMKNSWTETVVAGKILYVNAWDEKRLNTWERPLSGFIKSLPKAVPRTVYEQPQRRPTSDYYAQPGGW